MAYPTDTEKDKLDQNGAAPLQKAATPQAPKPVADTAPAAQNALLAPNPTDQRLAAGTATPPANPTSAPPAPNQGLIPQGANYGPAGHNPLMRAHSAPSEPAKMGDNMSAVLSENQKDVQAHRQAGNTAAAIGASVRGDLAMVPAFLADTGAAIAKDAAPAANAVSRFASSLFGGDGKSDIGAATPAQQPAQQPAVTMPATTTNPTDQRLAAGTQAPPMDPEAQATANPLTGWDRGKMTNADVAAANPAGQVRAVRGANGVMEFSGNNVTGPVSYTDAQGKAHAGSGINGRGWGGFDVAPAGAEVAMGPNGSYAFANNNPLAASPARALPADQAANPSVNGQPAASGPVARAAAGAPPVVMSTNQVGQTYQSPNVLVQQPQASQAAQAATTAALKAAAERGDFDAVSAHYANQGQGFGAQTAAQIQAEQAARPRMQVLGTPNALGFDPAARNARFEQDEQMRRMTDPTLKPQQVAAMQEGYRGAMENRRAAERLASEESRAAGQNQTHLQAAAMREQGENMRAGARNALAAGELGIRAVDAQGQANLRGAEATKLQRNNAVMQRYDAAQTDAERSAILNQHPEVFGQQKQQAPWRLQVTPTTKNLDGTTTQGSVIRYNEQTGDVQRVDADQGQPPAPKVAIDKNPDAAAIARNPNMTREQKAQALARMGY